MTDKIYQSKFVAIANHYHLKKINASGINIYYSGNIPKHLFGDGLFLKIGSVNFDSVTDTLLEFSGHFSFIAETTTSIIAAVDIVRSIPVFYQEGNHFFISNSARVLKQKNMAENTSTDSLLEFKMAGYVTGSKTIYSDIKQLQAGELLLFDKKTNSVKTKRYYIYKPRIIKHRTKEEYLHELGNIIDNAFKRVIKYANGREIVVPLSGGLDSRLIVAKLHSLNYSNLKTFSYGPKNNPEAKKAESIAKTLGVDWVFVKTDSSKAKKLFCESQRQKYWDYADGLSSLPVMNDYYSIKYLLNIGYIDKNSILVNGQSGDFISGGHIPFKDPSEQISSARLVQEIITKHFSIWTNLNSKSYLQYLDKLIHEQLEIDSDLLSAEQAAALFEQWEWQERQAKLVVNGQRLYEYFGLDWQLPLWAPDYVRFWETVPLEYRINQSLFKEYLQLFNYKNLFSDLRQPRNQNWSGLFGLALKSTVKLSNILKIDPSGMLRYACYYSHYSDQYALFGLRYFLNNIKNAKAPPPGRGILALSIRKWLQENSEQNN